MAKVTRLLVVPLAAGLVCLGGLAPHTVRADAPTWSVVEASQDFCVDASIRCDDTAHLSNLGYGEIAAVNRSGESYATPDTAVFVCAKAYRASDGSVHNLAGRAFPGYDPGVIRGTMHIYNNATETSTRATGKVQLYAKDYKLGTSAIAVGTQVTNNATDLPLAGNIVVVVSGNLEDTVGVMGKPTIVHGTISCQIHLPYAIGPNPIGQPPDSESVVADLDGD